MSTRDKKKTPAPTYRRNPTRRGLAPVAAEPRDFYLQLAPDSPAPEPASSTKPTRRDISARAVAAVAAVAAAGQANGGAARGEFSVGAARGVPSNEVSGVIGGGDDTKPPRTRIRRRSGSPEADVYLAAATKREITVIVNGQALKLDRRDAAALAAIIATSFS